MKICKYKKISKNKYKVFLEDKCIVLYENVILKYNLLYKSNIDNNLLNSIIVDNKKEEIYDLALSYIEIRKRSKLEVYKYLKNKKYEDIDINNVISKLEDINLIDDYSFSKSYINDKLYLTTSGLEKIKNELLNLGIKEEVIDDSIEKVDKCIIKSKLEKIISKEIKYNSNLPIAKQKIKITNKCINLGYLYEDIIGVLNNINFLSNANIRKSYDSIYLKYKNKYEGYKLKEVIKSKLYQKGYSIDEINSIIDTNI